MSAVSPEPLDNRLRVEVPEGIELSLRPAGPLRRAQAFAIDLGLRAALALSVLALFGQFGELGMGLGLILLFLLAWGYMVLFEVFNQGRSPGKQLLGLQVLHEDGTPVGVGASLLRNLLRLVDMLPLGYATGLLACLANPRFQRLGDLAAGTLVVHRPPRRRIAPFDTAAPQAAPFPLDAEARRALLAFAERQARLSAPRREELAALLAPALGVAPAEACGRLLAIAAELRGKP